MNKEWKKPSRDLTRRLKEEPKKMDWGKIKEMMDEPGALTEEDKKKIIEYFDNPPKSAREDKWEKIKEFFKDGDKRILIGTVGVDSGQLVICDPCYIGPGQDELSDYRKMLGIRDSREEDKPWGYFATQLRYAMGHQGLGVVFNSGCGDGEYDVYATIGEVEEWGVRVKKVEVILVDTDNSPH